MQTLSEIRSILETRGLAPRKAFGQNFLIDHNLIRKLADASGVGRGDVVVEVGPGTGTLTEELLARGCAMVACEIDRGLAALLRERFEGKAFTLVEGDCLESKHALSNELVGALRGESFTLVANLPYNAATPLIATLLTKHPECRGIFATVQLELAQRLEAKPGTKEYGPLSIVCAATATVERIATVPPECFWPRPEVTSAMVAIRPRSDPATDDAAGLLAWAGQRLFSARRKQIGSVLGRDFPFPAGISPAARAEQLGLADVLALYRAAR